MVVLTSRVFWPIGPSRPPQKMEDESKPKSKKCRSKCTLFSALFFQFVMKFVMLTKPVNTHRCTGNGPKHMVRPQKKTVYATELYHVMQKQTKTDLNSLSQANLNYDAIT